MTVPSPYVRRRWLAREIRNLRREHGCTGEELADAVGCHRNQISLLENAHRGPDIDLVAGICEFLQVGKLRREQVMSAAADGWSIGWWEANAAAMGRRQALYADLESGTDHIDEYALPLPPGLLQTSEFTAARMRSDPARQPRDFDPAAATAARARRQRLLLAPGGPRYELVLDEFAVRRCAAEPAIVAAQLRHIVAVCGAHPSIKVRILPIDATIKGHSAPRSAYSIYRYRDEHATLAVAADTLTTDLVLTETEQIDTYRELHSRLKVAALTPDDSLAMLSAVADRLDPNGGTPWTPSSSSTGTSPPAVMPTATASRSGSPVTAP